MPKQRYGFVDTPGIGIDLSSVIYHENHIKCYYFTDTGELKSEHLVTFCFDAKFILCRGLHILKYRMHNCKEETHPQNHKMKVSTSVHATNGSDENEMFVVRKISKCK